MHIPSDFAAKDSQRADNAARLIFVEAYANGAQRKRWDYAVTAFAAAEAIPVRVRPRAQRHLR